MKNVSIQGIIPPILTPMNADESINEQELRSQVNREIEAGVHGIFAFGTNGEAYALSAAEKDRVLEVVIEETNHRVPVYAGTGCITTKETIEMSKKAAAMGADVLSIITPYFAAASQDELYAHYMAVAEAVDLPIVLYNIPARTGNALSPATVAKLAKNAPNIVGAKDSSGNFDNLKQYIEQTRGLDKEFSVLSGNDSLILPALVFGGKGVGLMNMIMYVVLAVFICGLMIGRTPEYLGKKIEGREMKLAALCIIIHPFLILAFSAIAVVTPEGLAGITNSGFHGLSQVLYEYASSAANNGSGFEGLADNSYFWNITAGLAMFFGRYLSIILQMAIAGSLMKKGFVNDSVGTLRTDKVSFAVIIVFVVYIFAALTFFPALALGPIAEHLTLWG